MKAVTAGQLAMASDGVYSVTLDEAIEAMRLTAADMSVKYKETSLSVCVTVSWAPLIHLLIYTLSGTCGESPVLFQCAKPNQLDPYRQQSGFH